MIGSLPLDGFDARVRWMSLGEGAPLLFLPGLAVPAGLTFAHVAGHIAPAARRCILFDYPGSGLSDPAEGFDHGVRSMARTVAGVLDHLGAERVDIVGHSAGGTVALQLALDRPDLVGRIAVAESNVVSGGGAASSRIAAQGPDAFLERGFADLLADLREQARQGQDWADQLYVAWRHADPAAMFGMAKSLVDLDDGFLDRVAGLAQPRTFIYGSIAHDRLPAPDAPEPEALERAGFRISVVPRAGHAMMLDNPAGFVSAVREALEIDPPAGLDLSGKAT